jgi:hypothetical protein
MKRILLILTLLTVATSCSYASGYRQMNRVGNYKVDKELSMECILKALEHTDSINKIKSFKHNLPFILYTAKFNIKDSDYTADMNILIPEGKTDIGYYIADKTSIDGNRKNKHQVVGDKIIPDINKNISVFCNANLIKKTQKSN